MSDETGGRGPAPAPRPSIPTIIIGGEQPSPQGMPGEGSAPTGWQSFRDGFFKGDFSDDSSWWKVAGQVVGGIVPYWGQAADARDTIAAAKGVWDGKDGAWTDLGLAGIGWVPLAGDAIKGGLRVGRKAVKVGAEVGGDLGEQGLKRAGSHLREPPKYMDKNQGQGGGSPAKEPATSPPGRRPQRPNPDKWVEKGGKVQTHPDGRVTYTDKSGRSVTCSREGFPDFREAGHVKAEVTIDMKGNTTTDFTDANRALKALGQERPPNTTWHHHEDGKTMQLVDRELHKRFCHTGGVSRKRHGG